MATIITPVPPAIEQQACLPGMEGGLESTEPFSRRVTMRLMQGLAHISESLDTGIPERILAGVPSGVSANLGTLRRDAKTYELRQPRELQVQ